MTRAFDMLTWADEEYRKQAHEISNHYFTVDTAESEEVYDWVNYNRLMVTYALNNGIVEGFLTLIPLTSEAAKLFEKNEIREEDITTEHILSPDVMHYAEYFYLTGIAVRNYETYAAHQCTAAFMSILADLLLDFYDPTRIKKIFANPTTFQGNRMTLKLGLEKVTYRPRQLTGNDMYFATFDENLIRRLKVMQQRYSRFVGYNCWKEKDWVEKLSKHSRRISY